MVELSIQARCNTGQRRHKIKAILFITNCKEINNLIYFQLPFYNQETAEIAESYHVFSKSTTMLVFILYIYIHISVYLMGH